MNSRLGKLCLEWRLAARLANDPAFFDAYFAARLLVVHELCPIRNLPRVCKNSEYCLLLIGMSLERVDEMLPQPSFS